MWDNLPDHVRNPNPEIYKSDNYVVLDFEITSTNDDYGDARNPGNKILCAVWSCGAGHPTHPNATFVSEKSEYDLGDLVHDIEDADYLVAHSAKYELHWLRRCGLELQHVVVFCTQIAERVLAGNRMWGQQQPLDACARRRSLGHKDFVGKLIRSGVPTEWIPGRWLVGYCEKDVRLTERLFLSQRRDLYNRDLGGVYYTRMLLTPVLVAIESNGLKLDKERVHKLYVDHTNKLEGLKDEFNKLTGGINPRSPKQLGEFIYGKGKNALGFSENKVAGGKFDRTSSGKPKTDKATLAGLTATTKPQRNFLRLYSLINKLDHAVTKILQKCYDCTTETEHGLLYANLNQCVADTHRLSSTGTKYNVQFQNINREFKPLISARNPEWNFVEFDQAQLEFRVGVFLGQDKQGFRDLEDKVDIHSFSAANLFSEEWLREGGSTEEFTDYFKPKSKRGKELRQDAKAETFKPLYGGKYGSPEQMAYYAEFRKRYSGIASTQERWFNQVATDKYLRIPSGLIFYWPGASFKKGELPFRIQHQICNYPVQSLATADIVPISLVYLWHKCKAKGLETLIVNTVHDSVLAEVPDNEMDTYRQFAKEAFEKDVAIYMRKVYNIDFNVPLEAEETSSSHWSNSKQWENEYLGTNE